ncbi:MAG: hypothetical protein MJZ75_03645 [Paludibacteraceae bacterium]|nr:hypothetical protein [Paludibacteraceae bacterium]
MKIFSKLISCRWDIAFLEENLQEVVNGKQVHFIKLKNPFKNDSWFADPFILDVTDTYIYLLVEEMQSNTQKGVISKLTIDKSSWTITNKEVVLEEPWHLSFPFIIREGEKVFVAPESANGGAWYMYELTTDKQGKDKLERVCALCNDVVWDSIITNYWEEPYMFTAAQDDFHLDIYRKNIQHNLFVKHESLCSVMQDMRMAGNLFTTGNHIYCPSQISKPGSYGEAVEIKEVSHSESGWNLRAIRKIVPPSGILNDGLHTFNEYKGLIVVDIHRQNTIISLLIKKLVMLKKAIKDKTK